jgi:hypothetical protein
METNMPTNNEVYSINLFAPYIRCTIKVITLEKFYLVHNFFLEKLSLKRMVHGEESPSAYDEQSLLPVAYPCNSQHRCSSLGHFLCLRL